MAPILSSSSHSTAGIQSRPVRRLAREDVYDRSAWKQSIWLPGETVVFQEIWDDRLWGARPMRVVNDRGDSLALRFPKGTVWNLPTTPATRPRMVRRIRFDEPSLRPVRILGSTGCRAEGSRGSR